MTSGISSKKAVGVAHLAERCPASPSPVAEFGVNPATARKAVRVLVAEGLVYQIRGKGSYVTRRA